jgi:hypothetical protein
MAKESVDFVTGFVDHVYDSSYGGGERDGKPVERVERVALWVSAGFHDEPMGPLQCVLPQDMAIARLITRDLAVQVRVSRRVVVDRWGAGSFLCKAPGDGGPVFTVNPFTGEALYRQEQAQTLEGTLADQMQQRALARLAEAEGLSVETVTEQLAHVGSSSNGSTAAAKAK